MNGIVDRIIHERREVPADDDAKPDLLGFMLSGVDKQTGERLDDVNIRYQMNTFLIAGHETTSGLLSFAIYFLLKQPAGAAEGLRGGRPRAGPRRRRQADREQVNQLVYIGQILKESLRLWPTAPAFAPLPVPERDDRREIQAPQAHLRHRADGDAASRPSGVGTAAPRCSIPTTSRPSARPGCRRTPTSRSATASAPASAASSPCRRRPWCSA